jgi:glucose/arabinose dehydrogenase/cytochrome c551/c552/type 1 glutamine amidotransferase
MRHLFSLLALVAIVLLFSGCYGKSLEKQRVLVFSKTKGFRHSSIPNGIAAIQKLGKENGFTVDTTENSAYFTEDSLKHYSAVIFLSTTGDVLDHVQQAEFERYIQAGGGFMGIHAATDTEYGWPWYGKLVGAYFKSHPRNQKAKLIVHDRTHISTKHLPEVWERTDEWYNFKTPPSNQDYKILISIDETSYQGGENGSYHPMSWYHDYDGGRAFYTEFGHTEESYTEPEFVQHMLGGIKYAIGNNVVLDYSKATTLKVPDADRFTKNILATGFDEPTEMTILPNFDILVVQRKGEVQYYNSKTKKLTQVAKLNAYHKATVPGVNAEEGVLGLAADPDFAKNNFIYIFYSPLDTSVNRLSRFVFKDGKLDLKTEKVVMQFYSQRNICCHTGGSIAFGPDGNLYVSAGDNTTPFDQPTTYKLNGYGPMDDRPGLEQYDARRSSGNTNDLRGKIMRIKVNPDGSYSIPDGNLFPKGLEKTRPEIYVMGNRNPYRISVDRKTGFLYWGEVGPDAGNDSLARRGPRGYDELNQARKAGFFGWPYFVGNNYPYRRFDYATGVPGEPYDPKAPVNESRNNTGLKELPPVSPAFIWYPYAASPDFPEVGTGGRNAMAGPVYYPEFYPKETRYPDYYAGKLFFYDWIRGWVKAVSMYPNGDFEKMEPVLQSIKFNSLIDLEMGPDGRLYGLEYGTGWFTKNADAVLSRIDFNAGNRPPTAVLKVDKTSGALPTTVKLSAEGSVDPDKDNVTYVWHYGGKIKETKEPVTTVTFTTPGDNNVYVEVKDSKGAKGKSTPVNVYAGNEAPKVKITLPDNPSFHMPGKPVAYKVTVTDKEDGTKLDPSRLFVKVDYITGMDKAQVVGHQGVSAIMEGKALVETLDCKTCHKTNEKSIGPGYTSVAAKYAKNAKASEYLINKVIKGGSGVWGEVAMPAHPDLKSSDAQKIVSWILSLNKPAEKSLPAQGNITPTEGSVGKLMQISATYTDKGGAGRKPLSSSDFAFLESPLLKPKMNTGKDKVQIMDVGANNIAIMEDGGWMAFDVDLQYVKEIEVSYGGQSAFKSQGYIIEIFKDDVTGTKVTEVAVKEMKPNAANTISLKVPAGIKSKKMVVKLRKASADETSMMVITGLTLK